MGDGVKRANFIGAPAFYNLNHACQALTAAYGFRVYLVGSSIAKRDFRDVDVRCIMEDDAYKRMFPGITASPQYNALWSLTCAAISEWLSSRTGLPIDFQIQKQSTANADYEGPRHALGLFHTPPAAETLA